MMFFMPVMTSGAPQAQGGRRKDNDPSLIEAHGGCGIGSLAGVEEVMNWHRRLAALFVLLALAGCAQGITDQAKAPYAPYSPENNANMHDSAGGGGGGGGSM
jgi:hypothetical protein